MYKATIHLATVEKVKDFVNFASGYSFDIDLISGRYCVNGKSVLGIFSLDNRKDMALEADVPENEIAAFEKALEPFLK